MVEEEGFDDLLDETRDRVDEIEGMVSLPQICPRVDVLTWLRPALSRTTSTKRIDGEGALQN